MTPRTDISIASDRRYVLALDTIVRGLESGHVRFTYDDGAPTSRGSDAGHDDGDK